MTSFIAQYAVSNYRALLRLIYSIVKDFFTEFHRYHQHCYSMVDDSMAKERVGDQCFVKLNYNFGGGASFEGFKMRVQ